MATTEIKTRPTATSVHDFIEAVADDRQRAEAHRIAAMMERLSGHKPKMWGPSIIGFGSYHYKYESGREGDMCRIGFSPRKGQTVLYLVDGFLGQAELMAKLGKYKTGKSCLYIKKLGDVDESVLEQLCVESLKWMAQKYPE
ncbi:MAG: DUF1801 domain-containing protein [Sphingomonadaceae bacterium]|nr:DUF1801 domain-containing protein [Sphingomonadaceae bacterium]